MTAYWAKFKRHIISLLRIEGIKRFALVPYHPHYYIRHHSGKFINKFIKLKLIHSLVNKQHWVSTLLPSSKVIVFLIFFQQIHSKLIIISIFCTLKLHRTHIIGSLTLPHFSTVYIYQSRDLERCNTKERIGRLQIIMKGEAQLTILKLDQTFCCFQVLFKLHLPSRE